MIYERAARIKTDDDLEVIDTFKAAAVPLEEEMKAAIGTADAGLSKEHVRDVVDKATKALQLASADAVKRTKDAILAEGDETEAGHKGTNAERRAVPPAKEPPRPDEAALKQAAELQYDDILELAAEARTESEAGAADQRRRLRDSLEKRGFKLVPWHGD